MLMVICPTCSKRHTCFYCNPVWYSCIHVKRISDSVLSGNVGFSTSTFELCFNGVTVVCHFDKGG
jgi:hypothetical protein